MDAAEPPRIAAPAENPRPGPMSESPRFAATRDDDARPPSLELGVGAFFMVGGGAGGYAGVAPFLVDEFSQGAFLRPSIAFGQSVATNLRSTFAAARLDTCLRLPGQNASRNDIQLDVCAGPDVGFSYVASGTDAGAPISGQTLPYVALGPAVGLRAEAGGLAFDLRGLVDVNVARGGYVDVTGARVEVAPLTWRLELAVSWDVHFSRPLAQTASLAASTAR